MAVEDCGDQRDEAQGRRRFLAVWLAIGMIVSLLVGVGAGVLSYLAGSGVPASVLAGGVGLGGTATLILLIVGTIRGLET